MLGLAALLTFLSAYADPPGAMATLCLHARRPAFNKPGGVKKSDTGHAFVTVDFDDSKLKKSYGLWPQGFLIDSGSDVELSSDYLKKKHLIQTKLCQRVSAASIRRMVAQNTVYKQFLEDTKYTGAAAYARRMVHPDEEYNINLYNCTHFATYFYAKATGDKEVYVHMGGETLGVRPISPKRLYEAIEDLKAKGDRSFREYEDKIPDRRLDEMPLLEPLPKGPPQKQNEGADGFT